jgi:hypothetical protein
MSHRVYSILDRPIAFQRSFVDITGSVTAALMLSQAVYWSKRTSDDGWFWKTQEEWEDETGMSRREQESARRALRKTSFWREDRRGVPCRLFFQVDLDALWAELTAEPEDDPKNGVSGDSDQNGGKRHTRMADSAKQECTKAPSKNGGKRQTHYRDYDTETTAETTDKDPNNNTPDSASGSVDVDAESGSSRREAGVPPRSKTSGKTREEKGGVEGKSNHGQVGKRTPAKDNPPSPRELLDKLEERLDKWTDEAFQSQRNTLKSEGAIERAARAIRLLGGVRKAEMLIRRVWKRHQRDGAWIRDVLKWETVDSSLMNKWLPAYFAKHGDLPDRSASSAEKKKRLDVDEWDESAAGTVEGGIGWD